MQIYSCDAGLATIEGRLFHFDMELSTVNKEIQSLEEASGQLAVMLRNRASAADRLGTWLHDTTVMPKLVRAVRDDDVGDASSYSRTLHELQDKMQNMLVFVGHEQLQAFPTLQARPALPHACCSTHPCSPDDLYAAC
jgi:hypothetical protein